jgi:hypothetical protein
VTRDPRGYKDGPNLYAYVAASPANRTDPSGLQPPIDGFVTDAQKSYAGRKCLCQCGGKVAHLALNLAIRPIPCVSWMPSNPLAALDDELRAIEDAAWAFANATLAELGMPNDDSYNSALRHCYGSTMFAKLLGCKCAGCLGHYREQAQMLGVGGTNCQSRQTTLRTDWNNSVGRNCAGCSGKGNLTSPDEDEFAGDQAIKDCCKARIATDPNITLWDDLWVNEGPNPLEDPRCAEYLYPEPFPYPPDSPR